jgi:hypothetical protein
MIQKNAISAFQEASSFLELAEKELIRSEEDVVPQMICRSSRKAIQGFLLSFLLENGTNDPPSSLDLALAESIKINQKFLHFEMNKMECRKTNPEDNYCSNLKSAKLCLDLAKEAKNLVKKSEKKLWPKSKSIK